jgi:hypothetical protein
LADIFTVVRPKIVRKKLKISAQMDESFWRYRRYKYRGQGCHLIRSGMGYIKFPMGYM